MITLINVKGKIAMENLCQKLSSTTLNWNAAVGSIAGISLSNEVPAINLHSYKFYFARAIWFEVYQAGVKIEPTKVAVTWYPHKIVSQVTYPRFALTLQVCFVDKEVFAVNYSFESPDDVDLEVAIYGTARNGRSNDGYFNFRGRVGRHENCGVIDQEVDIPDYRSKPLGPLRLHTHHLVWVIDAPESIAVSQETLEVPHPERIDLNANEYVPGVNRSNYWLIKKQLSLRPAATTGGQFFVGTRWMGTAQAASPDYQDLRHRIQAEKARSSAVIEAELTTYWDGLLKRVPGVKERYRGNADYCDLYYKAWVCVIQNVNDTLVTSRKTIKGPSAMVGKVCSSGFGPAQWETSLAGFLISFINPDVGVGIIESVLNSLETDGFIPEDLVFNRDVKLSSYEPFMLEYIYRRTGRIEFLERNYSQALKQLIYHINHPGFYYLSFPSPGFLLDSYYSLLALQRIAVIIGKSTDDIRQLREYAADVKVMFDSLMADKGLDSLVYSAIYGGWDEHRTRQALDFIKKHMIPPPESYFFYHSPDGKRDGKDDPDSFKMNGYLFFILALEQLQAEDLLDTVVAKTFAGLKKNGDFWECYDLNGAPRGNGPMSIFGAFGWIWSLMDKEFPVNARQLIL